MADVRVIFFDIGDTLAAADFATGRLVLRPLPGVLQVLRRLQDSALRLGLISHTDGETTETMRRALTDAQLYPLFAAEPQLLIYSSEVHMRKDLAKDIPAGVRASRPQSRAEALSVCRRKSERAGLCQRSRPQGRSIPQRGRGVTRRMIS